MPPIFCKHRIERFLFSKLTSFIKCDCLPIGEVEFIRAPEEIPTNCINLVFGSNWHEKEVEPMYQKVV